MYLLRFQTTRDFIYRVFSISIWKSKVPHYLRVSEKKTVTAESQSFNETTWNYKGYQARQCYIEHVGKFDDTEVTALSHRGTRVHDAAEL